MFGPHLGSPGLYGNGSPYGSITGAGVTYDASTDTWTVTGVAYVSIDPDAICAGLLCRRLIVDGGTLGVSAPCKGLLVWPRELTMLNGGSVLMSQRGYPLELAADLNIHDLLPRPLKARVARGALEAYKVKRRGAEGGAPLTSTGYGYAYNGNPGYAAGAMQTGGGGSGPLAVNSAGLQWGGGGCGGPCGGGAGGGGGIADSYTEPGYSHHAADYGGAGGAAYVGPGSYGAGGGAGNPPAVNAPVGGTDAGRSGGLLGIFARASLSVASGCLIASDGAPGGVPAVGSYRCPGAPTGGGIIVAVTPPGGLINAGTMRAAAGAAPTSGYHRVPGAAGAGSVNTFTAQP